jgi:hypothetical protein
MDTHVDVEVPDVVMVVVLIIEDFEVSAVLGGSVILEVSELLGLTGTVVSFVVVVVNTLVVAVVTDEVVKLPFVSVPVLIDTQVAVEVPDVVIVVVLTVDDFDVSEVLEVLAVSEVLVPLEVDTVLEVAVVDA